MPDYGWEVMLWNPVTGWSPYGKPSQAAGITVGYNGTAQAFAEQLLNERARELGNAGGRLRVTVSSYDPGGPPREILAEAEITRPVKLTVDSSQGRGRRFEVTRVPQREGYGILSVLDPSSGHAPDPFLLLIDGRRAGGTYWCTYNPAPSGFGRDDGGLPDGSWASWGPRGLSCGHPSREAAEQAQVDVYKTDPDGWDMRLAGGHAELTPERDRPDGARFWDHRINRDFWAGYAATLARVRAERPSTVDGVAAILSGFQAPSAGIAFFGNNADDRLSDALADAGWQLRFLERDYLWEARHLGTGERLHCVEGDVYPGSYETAASANLSATTQSVQVERSIDYPDPVKPGAPTHVAARPAAANQVRPPAARRTP